MTTLVFTQQIHAVADRMVPAVRAAFLRAIDLARRAVPLREIEAALQTKNINAVLNVLQPSSEDLILELRRGSFVSALRDTYLNAGAAVLPMLDRTDPRRASVGFKFDLTNPRSVEFLRAYDGNLIKQMSDTLRQTLIEIVRTGFEAGRSPLAMAYEMRDARGFGLLPQGIRSLENYRAALEESGMVGEKLERAVARFERKLLLRRAETVARTETINASEAGNFEAMRQGGEIGLFDPDSARRKWILTKDDRLCDACRAIPGMNPDGVPFLGQFQTPLGPRTHSPAHPRCRCSVGIMFSEDSLRAAA